MKRRASPRAAAAVLQPELPVPFNLNLKMKLERASCLSMSLDSLGGGVRPGPQPEAC